MIEYERFKADGIREVWEQALTVLQQNIQRAVAGRGLPPLVFEC
jgi:hypothetical protein